MFTRSSAPVRFVTATLGAVGGYALAGALLGTTVVLTTSWLVAALAFVLFVLAYALAIVGCAYVGYHADKAISATKSLFTTVRGVFAK